MTPRSFAALPCDSSRLVLALNCQFLSPRRRITQRYDIHAAISTLGGGAHRIPHRPVESLDKQLHSPWGNARQAGRCWRGLVTRLRGPRWAGGRFQTKQPEDLFCRKPGSTNRSLCVNYATKHPAFSSKIALIRSSMLFSTQTWAMNASFFCPIPRIRPLRLVLTRGIPPMVKVNDVICNLQVR